MGEGALPLLPLSRGPGQPPDPVPAKGRPPSRTAHRAASSLRAPSCCKTNTCPGAPIPVLGNPSLFPSLGEAETHALSACSNVGFTSLPGLSSRQRFLAPSRKPARRGPPLGRAPLSALTRPFLGRISAEGAAQTLRKKDLGGPRGSWVSWVRRERKLMQAGSPPSVLSCVTCQWPPNSSFCISVVIELTACPLPPERARF